MRRQNRTLAPPSFIKAEGEPAEQFSETAASYTEEGDRLRDLGDYKGAIAAYQLAKDHHGGKSHVLANRIGIAFQAMGDHEQAIVHFTESLEIEDDPVDRVNRATSYIETTQCPLAIQDAQKALEMEVQSGKGRRSDADAHSIIGVCHYLSDQHEDATRHLLTAAPIMLSSGYAASEIAYVYELAGNAQVALESYPEAIRHYSQAITAEDDSSTRMWRAWSYWEQGDCAKATEDAQQSLKLPAYRESGYHSQVDAYKMRHLCEEDPAKRISYATSAMELMRTNGYDEAAIKGMLELIKRDSASEQAAPEVPAGGSATSQAVTPGTMAMAKANAVGDLYAIHSTNSAGWLEQAHPELADDIAYPAWMSPNPPKG